MRVTALFVCFCLAAGARDVRVRLHKGNVIRLSLEDYVAGVLAGEVSTLSSAEGLKAMAVAARTFAVRYTGRHAAEGYDFCESTHCQDFRMRDGIRQSLRAAVEATDLELLWYDGRPAATHYHRHCGGRTAASAEIWPDVTAPYLRSITDTFCLLRGRAEWNTEVPGRLRILRRTASGRVAEIELNGRRITGDRFPSNLFDAFPQGASTRLSGIGTGHGVGLCQIGADERGKAGQTYDQILATYYPGTTLSISAGGLRWRTARSERADIYATAEPDLRELGSLADSALKQAEKITGFPAAERPRVRAYPTIAIYRDATGDSGHVAATTSGNLIRLQPLSLLRSGGTLHSTLLHEMLHVLIETNAAPGLPVWYREGLAQHLGGARSTEFQDLERRYGRPTLLAWVRSGLPRSVAQTRQIPAATPARSSKPK